jgi:hypothetical protein
VHDPHSSWTAPRLKSKLAPLAAKIKLRVERGASRTAGNSQSFACVPQWQRFSTASSSHGSNPQRSLG